jgi:hypothetical protein
MQQAEAEVQTDLSSGFPKYPQPLLHGARLPQMQHQEKSVHIADQVDSA